MIQPNPTGAGQPGYYPSPTGCIWHVRIAQGLEAEVAAKTAAVVAKKPPAKNLLAEFSDDNAEGPRRKCAPAVEAAKKKPEAPKPLAVQAEPSSSKTSVRLEPQQHMLTQYQPPSKVRGATGNRKIDGFQGSMFHVGHFVFELIENKQRLSRMHYEIDIALKRDKGDYGLPLNAPRMLLNAIAQGDLAPLEPDRMELLQSLDKLNEIATTGYFSNTKFVHIEPAQPKLRIAASQASASARLDIYFGEGSDAETIFGLAADYDVWTLMHHITPAGPIKRPPPRPRKSRAAMGPSRPATATGRLKV